MIRLQKQLADAGYGSRRQIEDWIRAGRLQVNGETASLGTKVNTDMQITLDGKPLICTAVTHQPCRVILYHKPEGQLCTRHDPEQRPTVFDALPKLKQARWISIGRLDFNTSGLLLLTTHGELANRLMHPTHGIIREYAVRVLGKLIPSQIRQLTHGVTLDDGTAAFESVRHEGGEGVNQWYHVTIAEGRKREVRRLFEAFDLQVSRLIRIGYGDVQLPKSLSRGHWRDLSPKQIESLAASVGLEVRPYAPRTAARTQDDRAPRSTSYRSEPTGRPTRKPAYLSQDDAGSRTTGRRGESTGRPTRKPAYLSQDDAGSRTTGRRGESTGRPTRKPAYLSQDDAGSRTTGRRSESTGRPARKPAYLNQDDTGSRATGRRSESTGRPTRKPAYLSQDDAGSRTTGRRSESESYTTRKATYRGEETENRGSRVRRDVARDGNRPSSTRSLPRSNQGQRAKTDNRPSTRSRKPKVS